MGAFVEVNLSSCSFLPLVWGTSKQMFRTGTPILESVSGRIQPMIVPATGESLLGEMAGSPGPIDKNLR